jgi:hypothetical protein
MRCGFVPAVGVLVSLGLLLLGSVHADPTPSRSGTAALDAAAKEQKYLFILFWKEENAATQAVRQVLETALPRLAGRAAWVAIRTDEPGEKAVVDKFGVSRAPLPLVLAVAPNGAITGGFPLKLTEQNITSAFVSPATGTALKALQARKLVLLCVQPANGQAVTPSGILDFKADPQYGPATELVSLRADDAAEAKFLNDLRIDPRTTVPVTALLAPPGKLLGSFQGSVSKQQIVEKLKTNGSCCPGGKCCPGGCCGPKQ